MNGLTKDDIIRMAREAGFEHIAEANYWHPLFKRFADLVAAAEREACAKVCDEQADEHAKLHEFYELAAVETLADAIRERGAP
jgi:hypothetical protein